MALGRPLGVRAAAAQLLRHAKRTFTGKPNEAAAAAEPAKQAQLQQQQQQVQQQVQYEVQQQQEQEEQASRLANKAKPP